MNTPGSTQLKRTLSILQGPQFQQSLIKSIPSLQQHQHPQQQIDLPGLLYNSGAAQQQPKSPATPNMLFQQPSFVQAQQNKAMQQPLKSGDFNIPQPRFQ